MLKHVMDLYIETLTGTAFELRVSPFETVISVKAKIQRQEGIPISQQHLIWQTTELDDDNCLHDYGIHDGATLKMVLAMRGGPINTRRVPMDDPTLREMAEYMEANRDELAERLPGNHQVTLLLYRDGDQLKFCRFLDMGDGTLTPLSESLSGGSVCNAYEDEDDDEVSNNKDKVDENDKMKEKMLSLRNKMENLSINKKPKKKHHVVCRTPTSGRPSSRGRLRHLTSGKGTASHHLMARNPLPPVGQTMTSSVSPAIITEMVDDDLRPPSINKLESAKFRRLPSVQEDTCLPVAGTTSKTSPVDMDSFGALLQRAGLSNSSRQRELKEYKEYHKELSQTQDTLGHSIETASRPQTSSLKKDITLEALKDLSIRNSSSSKVLERLLSYDGGLKDKEGRPSSKISNIERMSQSEARGLLRQASLERLGSSKLGTYVRSASRSRAGYGLKDQGRITTPEGRMVSARLQRLSASRDGRVMSPSSRLPPVKQKKKFKRCFLCTKKTGLATSYQCRCGNNFCATHRYAEAHSCTFDYKTEGRKLLEQSNPVVNAPKLPKI